MGSRTKEDYIKAISTYDREVNNDKYGGLLVKLMEKHNKINTAQLTLEECKAFYNEEILGRR